MTTKSSAVVTVFCSLAVVAGLLLCALLIWGLRALILPVVVGSLLAYLCYPVVASLERFRMKRGLAIALLLVAFVFAGLFLFNRVSASIPTGAGLLEFRVRALHNINRRYQALMGLDPSLTRGNRIYRFAHDDLDPLVDRVNRTLALTPEEESRFVASQPDPADAPIGSRRLRDYHRDNIQTLQVRGRTALAQSGRKAPEPAETARTPKPTPRTPLAALADILSTWVVAPAVFLFLLRDTGEIKRSFLRTIPNRLFEPVLAVLTDLDRALGGYVRGILLESAFLGTAVATLLTVLGVPLGWAILIGLVSGATNPVPYVGSAVALLSGLAFVLVADDVHPLLPLVRGESVAIWMIVGIILIEIFKNVVFEPLVLGDAVEVHPLVVLLGVLGGGILFGLVGLLLALPTITMVKALVSSTSRQLKAYGFI